MASGAKRVGGKRLWSPLADLTPNNRNVSWLCETVRYPFWRLTPHSIDTLFWTIMSNPNDPRENHLKRKFEELPDQVMITDRPCNKRRGGLRLEFMISWSSIDLARLSFALPTLITPSSTIHAADIAMSVTSKILSNLPTWKWTLIAHQIKFAGDQVKVPEDGVIEHLQQALPTPTGLHYPQTSMIYYWWLWCRFPEFSLAYLSTNCSCSECRPGVSGHWNDCCLWDITQPVCYKVDIDLHWFWSYSWPGWRPCWILATAFFYLDWFMLAPNFCILFLITLYRSFKFWLVCLSTHSFYSECRSDACWSVL